MHAPRRCDWMSENVIQIQISTKDNAMVTAQFGPPRTTGSATPFIRQWYYLLLVSEHNHTRWKIKYISQEVWQWFEIIDGIVTTIIGVSKAVTAHQGHALSQSVTSNRASIWALCWRLNKPGWSLQDHLISIHILYCDPFLDVWEIRTRQLSAWICEDKKWNGRYTSIRSWNQAKMKQEKIEAG